MVETVKLFTDILYAQTHLVIQHTINTLSNYINL